MLSPDWVAQLVGTSSSTPKGCALGSIPGQGAYRKQMIDVSLSSLSLSPLPLSLKLINISLGED